MIPVLIAVKQSAALRAFFPFPPARPLPSPPPPRRHQSACPLHHRFIFDWFFLKCLLFALSRCRFSFVCLCNSAASLFEFNISLPNCDPDTYLSFVIIVGYAGNNTAARCAQETPVSHALLLPHSDMIIVWLSEHGIFWALSYVASV